MADSDNSTTLPSVTNGLGGISAASRGSFSPDADPALMLLREWRRAQHVSMVLCRLQQRLERRLLGAKPSEAAGEQAGYAVAYQAEVEAMTAVLRLQDNLPDTRARSLLGIVAKLEMIVGADREIDDPTEFPWPHIASVLRDLKEIAGSVRLERPERSVVHAECNRYQAMAARLIARDGQVGVPGSGDPEPVVTCWE